jgi:hypothetical protein
VAATLRRDTAALHVAAALRVALTTLLCSDGRWLWRDGARHCRDFCFFFFFLLGNFRTRKRERKEKRIELKRKLALKPV